MYAIVRAGGHQEKVAVGDVVEFNRFDGEPGSEVTLPAVLVVDGDTITTGAALDKVGVTAEIVEHGKGPKIEVGKFKNKTGYRRRTGHRQQLTKVKITAIKTGK